MPMIAAASSGVSALPSILTAKSGLRDLSSDTGARPLTRGDAGLVYLTWIHVRPEGGCSAPNGKGTEVPANRGVPDFDVLDVRSGRAAAAPGDEVFDSVPLAFDHGFDAAVGQVENLAGEPQAQAFRLRAGAVEDALDAPADGQVRADRLSVAARLGHGAE